MAVHKVLDINILSKLLRLDGSRLFWLERPDGTPQWNGRYAGTEALTYVGAYGYKFGNILNRPYFTHRVIWAMHHGAWPVDQLDHINGIRTDNRIENLREVDDQENRRNQARPSHNTSGVTGVSWYKQRDKWRSFIVVKGRTINLGYFASFDDAVAARKAAEAAHGFHKNHGR